ncbi:MAG: hypothetical protein ACYSTS_06635 [Planctomycetota bacterium]|jgi:hypothetical protein
MANWLKKLSGWYWLFFVYACTHLIIVTIRCSSESHHFWRTHFHKHNWIHHSYDDQYIMYIFTYGILPICGVFLLGLALRWATKGFGKEKENTQTD